MTRDPCRGVHAALTGVISPGINQTTSLPQGAGKGKRVMGGAGAVPHSITRGQNGAGPLFDDVAALGAGGTGYGVRAFAPLPAVDPIQEIQS